MSTDSPKCAIVTPTHYSVSTNAYRGACVPVRSLNVWTEDRFAAELLFWRDDEASSGLPVITEDTSNVFYAELLVSDFEDIYAIFKHEENVEVAFQCDGQGGYRGIRVSGGGDVQKVHQIAERFPKSK